MAQKDLSVMLGKVRTCQVSYFEDQFAVSYRPSEITSETEREDAERQAASEPHVLADRLAKVIVAWDLAENEQPIPITQEYMRTLPSPLLAAIRSGVMEDMAPKPKSARGSFAR